MTNEIKEMYTTEASKRTVYRCTDCEGLFAAYDTPVRCPFGDHDET